MVEVNAAQTILVGMPEGKRPLGKHSQKREVDVIMDLKESLDWIHVAQDRDR
jgi:hypothetical protein